MNNFLLFNAIIPTNKTELAITLISIAAFVIGITFHEYAHGYVALKCGDDTALRRGRVSLNPIVHFDLIGFLMMVFCGFGFAKGVPVNPNNFRNYKKGTFFVAIAGVSANFILMFLAIPLYYLFYYYNITVVGFFFEYFAIVNAALIVFNLLPIFPLDGFRIVEAFTSPFNKFRLFMQRYGVIVLFGLLIWGVVIDRLIGFGLPYWLSYLDILGTALFYLRTYLMLPFQLFWQFIFGLIF